MKTLNERGNDMNDQSSRWKLAIWGLAAMLGLGAGCQEPNYRMDVRPTGEGGVNVQRIPKDDPVPPPASDAPALSQSPQPPQSVDAQIDALEKQVRAKNAEIERLKQEKAAHPTTEQ
jgi:hypothetical protein